MWWLILLLLAMVTPAHAYNLVVGSYAVGGSASDNRDISVSPSFAINLVMIKCDASASAVWATSAIASDLTHTLADGTTAAANRIQSMGTGTFQVGTDASVQSTSTTCYYAAFGVDANNDMAVGNYTSATGTCADNCDVVISPAFLPDVVWLGNRTVGTAVRIFKTSAMAGQLACRFSNVACSGTDTIQALNANGFQYGSSAIVNTNTAVYDYVAFKSVPTFNEAGTFTGDTNDDRDIATINTPTVAFVKPNTTTTSCGRWGGIAGDASWVFTAVSPTTNQIQAFSATGFQVGTAGCANSNGIAMYWWASKTPVYTTARPRGSALYFQ